MHYSDEIEVHYPSTVMERQFEGVDGLNTQLFELLRGLAEKYSDTAQNAVNSGLISTQGGYQTATSVNLFTLKSEAIEQFRDRLLLPTAQKYLHHIFGDQAAQFRPWPDGWANLLGDGDWQRPHFHPSHKNVASGVYYVHIPEDKPEPQGNIEFFNPIPVSVNHGFPSTRRLLPREGKMILFPPWYVHYVYPFRGEGERAIIAFDILAQKPGSSLAF
jgi:uncharacterized protein (TIGR02466 family)